MSSLNMEGVLKTVRKVQGGVSLSHKKNTADFEIVRINTPDSVVIPMQQHVGVPCTPTVKIGDTVDVGQIIGDSDKYVSAPIHASISGTVKAVSEVRLPNGVLSAAVKIESDGEMREYAGIEPPTVENRDDLIKAARASGLVGLGGAGFPAHVKLNLPKEANIDTLIINAAECEPYITVDYRECVENSWDVLSGIYSVKELLGIKKVIIAIEDNKPEALDILKRIADRDGVGNGVQLMALKSVYPQGAEKLIIQSATGRRVPPGKLPSDVGCMVMNVASISFLARYLKTGKPLVSRSLTVDGSAISWPKNVRVPIGISVREIINFCGGLKTEPYKIITGGPMMGFSITNTELPVLKQNNAILAFSKEDAKYEYERDCIRCGRCAEACPMGLMPTLIARYAKARKVENIKKVGTNVCMECGSCAYSCPAAKPLVQSMRLAKQILREEGAK